MLLNLCPSIDCNCILLKDLISYFACWSSPLIYVLSSLNGVEESGEVDWTGCRNVKLRRLETATAFAHYIEVGTSYWKCDFPK